MRKENSELELKTNRDEYDIYYKGHIVGNILYDIYTDELYEERKKAFIAGLQFNQEEVKKWKMVADENGTHYDMLEEENKNLSESNLNLQKWVDNKEKVNKQLREENAKLKKYYDRDKEELMESCYGLARENDKLKSDLMQDMKEITKLEKENKNLKSDLSECECSFGFENDEVGYRKREYKRLKKWIKDHCKGYGNLFPEDEMKRQWKKADKKRK